MAPRNLVRRQLRGFVTMWVALTGMIAVATFFAIYLTYGGDSFGAGARSSVALIPTNTSIPQAAINVTNPPTLAAASTNTQEPTVAPSDTSAPTEQVEALVATEETSSTDAGVQTVAEVSTTVSEPTVAVAPTIPPIDVKDFQVGIQVQPDPGGNQEYQNNWMREVKDKIGFGWVKTQIRWADIEKTKGEYDWGAVRFPVSATERFGLKMMVSVVTAPDWAREPGIDLTKNGPPANAQDYVNFVSAMMEKFKGNIQAIEVWNEENLDREWMSNSGLNAVNYVNLLRQTYQAVKQIDPTVIVISGALSPGGGWTEADGRISAVDDFAYFDGLIQAGLLDYTDCVGAHHNGYNIGPSVLFDAVPDDPAATFRGPFDNPHHSWSFRSTLETYHSKIQAAGSDKKLCITEFGWPSTEDLTGTPAGFGFAADNTLEEQKTWTVEALNNMDEWGFVWLAFIWNFNYGPQAGWSPDNDNVPYSIIGPDWVHRPVYDAIIEWQQARLASGKP
ncbi:MAG TPA: hypothetical protein VHL11_08300 [Phototrophicaceae bacterium]|jgi:hypothetical protein|nr:hypothetical protein [Phototrophicaceae bacterium]